MLTFVTIPKGVLTNRLSGPVTESPSHGWLAAWSPRAKGTAAVVGIASLLAGLIVGCAGAPARPTPSPSKYAVAATVEVQASGLVACYPGTKLSAPPPPCFGIPLSNVSPTQLAIAYHLPDGTSGTAPLHLIGTWARSSLRLTEPPKATVAVDGRPRPPTGTGTAPANDVANRERMMMDQDLLRAKGIWVLESGFSGAGSYAVVAVDDGSATAYLRSHYAVDTVLSWLRPTSD